MPATDARSALEVALSPGDPQLTAALRNAFARVAAYVRKLNVGAGMRAAEGQRYDVI
jgi:hypothetical protein